METNEKIKAAIIIGMIRDILTILVLILTIFITTYNFDAVKEILKKHNVINIPCEIMIYYTGDEKNNAIGLKDYLMKNKRHTAALEEVDTKPIVNWRNTIRYFNRDDKSIAQLIQSQVLDFFEIKNIRKNILTIDFSSNRPIIKNSNPISLEEKEIYTIRDGYIEIWLSKD
jgi:hypothetical protein